MKLAVAAVALLVTSAAPAPTSSWKLTPAGWGPVRIGMSRDQVGRALQVELHGEPLDDDSRCIEMFPEAEALSGVYFMFLDGKLSRVTVAKPNGIETPRGIRVRSTADEVRAAYGERLRAEPHHYLDLPAEYLTFWLEPGKSGVRFETDAQRKVETIHAGNDSIQLIEGCA